MKLIFTALFNIILFSQLQAINLDSLIKSLSSLNDSARVDSMIKLARFQSIQENGENGVLISGWALKEAQQLDLEDLIPKARFYLAAGFNNLGIVDSCVFHYEKALQEMKGTAHESWAVHVYNNIINSYRNKGYYQKALNAGFRSLAYFESINDTVMIPYLYTEIGYIYDRMKDYNKAIKWQRKSLKIYRRYEDKYMQNYVNSRIGIAYDDLGIYDSAHYYNKSALDYHESIGDSVYVGTCVSNIGNTYIKQEKWEEAKKYLERACRLVEEHGDNGMKAIANINLGNTLMHTGSYDESRFFLQRGLKFAKLWKGKKIESEAYYRLHELFLKQDMADSSLVYYKKFKVVEDSLYNIEKLRQIEGLSVEYETEKKIQQIQLQEADLQEKESQLYIRQAIIAILIVLTLLILVASIAVYKRYQAKKNTELQQKIIEEQERGLKAVYTAQEEERKRISKDLHDGIGQQLSGLKMAFQQFSRQLKNYPEKEKEVEKLAEIISETADEVRSISHQMMPRALTELGLVDALEDMFSKSFDGSKVQYQFEHYAIDKRLPESTEVSLYRICQELTHNIIKHSDASMVSIQLFKNAGKVILIVEDNGKGMKESSSDGHGLLNIRNRLNTLKGEVNFEPSPSSGTLVTIRIPL